VSQVRVTCHDPAAVVAGTDLSKTLHLLASAGVVAAESASVVVVNGRGRVLHDLAAWDALHESARQYPGARVVAMTSGRCALAWVRVQPQFVWEPTGYTLSVGSTSAGPAELYPSVIYGWVRWWATWQAEVLPPGFPLGVLLPHPPRQLDAVVQRETLAWDTYRLDVIPVDRPGTFRTRDPEDPTEWR
jgi:hypothetical protein